jgi:hypothetical protein
MTLQITRKTYPPTQKIMMTFRMLVQKVPTRYATTKTTNDKENG